MTCDDCRSGMRMRVLQDAGWKRYKCIDCGNVEYKDL